jgi:TRAP-type C4-dicarboxylate transport system permease small subunit
VNTLFDRLERFGAAAEDATLSLLLVAMIFIASAQIIGRNLFDATFVRGDELLRIIVLWLTLAGAVAASRADRHISIAVLDRFLSGRLLDAARAFIHLFTAGICGLLCWHSIAFVRLSHEFGDVLLENVPAWLLQLALPIGFGLMTWRHGLHALRNALGHDGEGRAPGGGGSTGSDT